MQLRHLIYFLHIYIFQRVKHHVLLRRRALVWNLVSLVIYFSLPDTIYYLPSTECSDFRISWLHEHNIYSFPKNLSGYFLCYLFFLVLQRLQINTYINKSLLNKNSNTKHWTLMYSLEGQEDLIETMEF